MDSKRSARFALELLDRNGKLSNLDFSNVRETSSKQYKNIAFRSLFEEDYYRFMDENNYYRISNKLSLGRVLREQFQLLRPDIHDLIVAEAERKCPSKLRRHCRRHRRSISSLRKEKRELQEVIYFLWYYVEMICSLRYDMNGINSSSKY